MWIVGCSNYGYGNATEFIKLEQGTGDYIPDEMADGNYSDIPIPSPTYLNRGKGALKCPMKGPYLPFKIYDHSVEKYDDSNIYIIGNILIATSYFKGYFMLRKSFTFASAQYAKNFRNIILNFLSFYFGHLLRWLCNQR